MTIPLGSSQYQYAKWVQNILAIRLIIFLNLDHRSGQVCHFTHLFRLEPSCRHTSTDLHKVQWVQWVLVPHSPGPFRPVYAWGRPTWHLSAPDISPSQEPYHSLSLLVNLDSTEYIFRVLGTTRERGYFSGLDDLRWRVIIIIFIIFIIITIGALCRASSTTLWPAWATLGSVRGARVSWWWA